MTATALEGVRVLDFSAMIAGPYCTRLLADLGAEVIKVEPPEGDYMRSREPRKEGFGLYFGMLNAGKRSIGVDLKKPAGVALVKALAAKCDVVLENFRPGVMKRLGLGSEVLRAAHPKLVFCSISGYGQAGKYSGLPAYAPIVQAASGYELANMEYQRGLERPLNSGIFAADYLTGVHAFGAICAALVRRARTGEGETIDCAMMDAMLGMLAYEVAEAQAPVSRPRLLYQATRAKDGYLITAPITQGNFEAMARAAGHEEWLRQERFATPTARGANWDALMAELDVWAADKTVAECEAKMAESGCPCARYATVREAMASAYASERGVFATVQGGGTEFRAPNAPFKMSGVRSATHAPALGEHGAEVLEEVLGSAPDEIARLQKEGVLCRKT
jgi:crotonobetainyl-CoA:carnitine CoA-transferase CaiB-like acyl-CoA transferase